MTTHQTIRTTTAAGGVLLLAGFAAAPAFAAEYPPENPTDNQTNQTNTVDTSSPTQVTTNSGDETPAYTGAATTLALAAGVVALGAGAGLLIASKRREQN